MDIEEFARLEVARGAPVIFHHGIWWQRVKPSYSWPLQLLRAFPPAKEKRPPLLYGSVGFEHAAPEADGANATLPLMLLRDLSRYDINCLSANKRRDIRRGMKRVEVRKLDEIRDLVEQGLGINRSALTRQAWGGNRRGYLNEQRWRREIEQAHALGARETWGVYLGRRLVAYLRMYVLDETVHITQTMSHSDYLEYYPNDALLNTFLMDCKVRPGVRSVLFGLESAKQSLNEYKRKFGFEVVKLPVYRRLNPVVRYLARFTRYRQYIRG